jgi:hypothetical protein
VVVALVAAIVDGDDGGVTAVAEVAGVAALPGWYRVPVVAAELALQ